ncbi:MAG: serpin family protein [Gemmatimonadaceae bacterium]|nr:serpin family protein [Gemmatimonadaceae bacterium]
MRRFGVAVLCCTSLVLSAACSDSSGPGEAAPNVITTLPRSLSGAEQGIITAANGFGFRLLGRINSASPSDNHFISPLSASMALGMLVNGAAGTTETEMRTTLGFGTMSRTDVLTAYRDLIALLRGLDSHVDFRIANSIFYRDTFAPFVEPTFLSESKSYFDASTAGLDFNSPSALTTINGWAKTATNGKIEEVLKFLDADLMMILMNAIYFKGDWRQAFDPKRTSNAPFTPEGGAAVSVPMMHLTDTMRVGLVDGRQVVDLGYGGDAFSMTVVLPRTGETVASLVNSLDAATWTTLTSSLRTADTELSLPRFKMSWERLLNPELKAMGMPTAFIGGVADFTRLSSRKGNELFISFVKQNSFVDVNEVGTEAAAVTTIGIGVVSLPQRVVMNVNRPFVFAIRERISGTILFVGKIMTPTAA